MKILQVISKLDRGGAETLLVNILENIPKNNFQFDFLVFGEKKYAYEEKIEQLGGNIIRMPSPNDIGMFNFIKKLKKIIKKNNYELIHAHTLFNCGPVMLAAFLAGVKKRISHSHNTKKLEEKVSIKKQIYFFLAKILINIFSTQKIACGEEAGKFLFWGKYHVLKNGILIDKYRFSLENRKKIRFKHDIEDDDLVIGHIGRFTYQKNHEFLIELFNEIKKSEKKCKLILLGDGELKQNIIEKINQLDLKDDILLLGNLANANEYYSAFDCFVFPSRFEGLPYTLIEAQCNGLPIFASDSISKECDISKTIEFISINKLPIEWAEIIDKKYNSKRCDNEEKIIKTGYDIRGTVSLLEKIYGGNDER